MVDGNSNQGGGAPQGGGPSREDDPQAQSSSRSGLKGVKNRRAMTRMIERVSDEFVSTFSETGVDHGPESAQTKAQQREAALKAREEREAREEAETQVEDEKPVFRGFASLMGAKRATSQDIKKGGMFSRLLSGDDEPETAEKPELDASSTDASPIDGVIKVKGTVGKKRGLYTSCMKKPILPMGFGGEADSEAQASQESLESVRDIVAAEVPHAKNLERIEDIETRTQEVDVPTDFSPPGGAKPIANQAFGRPSQSTSFADLAATRPDASGQPKAGERSNPLASIANTSKGADRGLSVPAAASKANTAPVEPPQPPAPEIPAKIVASGAREFQMPSAEEVAKQAANKDYSTLRRLANDGKGTNAIRPRANAAPQYESVEVQTPATPVSTHEAQGESCPISGLFCKVTGFIKGLFGKRS